ncbi:stage IV sporulation protein FB [Sulfobacillus thermosulfidooxidans DSM 9293]|uniref:Stage IV sporulation protein FB n=1 Tax=Sulfobacillus thermosulfidooxidans (strain DSM 9293 / VKM B-1269 / AT-1) TaxID=929705 RepID=A0A1W1W8J6_SULTA|nr:site-2 protease family protein [Sulfobacillus thermosulfidooxidans]SMC02606.1 stage IV sporulation protein FB [Sulfobacillus thermosulfidooxidans DSM 9293]
MGLWRKISVNPWFVVLLLVYIFVGQGLRMALAFFVVTLHELTHAVIAESYGTTVERIEIWPFGGIARIAGMNHQEPYVEAMIAVVGPLQNFILASVAWLAAPWLPVEPRWIHEFIHFNLAIGLLNLLPVAPLDGGHLARLFWARKIGYEAAQQRVIQGGVWLARILFVITVLSFLTPRPLLSLGLFALFLHWGALHSDDTAPYLIVRDLNLRAGWFQKKPIWTLDDFAVHCDTPLKDVLKVMRPMKYHRVVILSPDMKKMGILYEEDLLQGLHDYGPGISLRELLTHR